MIEQTHPHTYYQKEKNKDKGHVSLYLHIYLLVISQIAQLYSNLKHLNGNPSCMYEYDHSSSFN